MRSPVPTIKNGYFKNREENLHVDFSKFGGDPV